MSAALASGLLSGTSTASTTWITAWQAGRSAAMTCGGRVGGWAGGWVGGWAGEAGVHAKLAAPSHLHPPSPTHQPTHLGGRAARGHDAQQHVLLVGGQVEHVLLVHHQLRSGRLGGGGGAGAGGAGSVWGRGQAAPPPHPLTSTLPLLLTSAGLPSCTSMVGSTWLS